MIHTGRDANHPPSHPPPPPHTVNHTKTDSGATVVVSGGNFGEMALHFLDKYGLMAVKVPSKFDLRRVCRATGAVALMGTAAPTAAELGHAGCVELREVGSTPAVLFGGQASRAGIATIVLRGATDQLLDDVERAVDGGVNAFRALTKDARALPAGGAVEIELARRLADMARKVAGAGGGGGSRSGAV